MTPRNPAADRTDQPSAKTAPSEGLARIEHGQPAWRAVTVEHLDGERYAIGVRGHMIVVDQPYADGGDDTGVTPTELLVAALASCVALYAGRFLDRHGISRRGLRVSASFTMAADRPARVESMTLRITAPALPEERRATFLAVVSRCTVHNTLHRTPQIDVGIDVV
jgi:putative redox protein